MTIDLWIPLEAPIPNSWPTEGGGKRQPGSMVPESPPDKSTGAFKWLNHSSMATPESHRMQHNDNEIMAQVTVAESGKRLEGLIPG